MLPLKKRLGASIKCFDRALLSLSKGRFYNPIKKTESRNVLGIGVPGEQ